MSARAMRDIALLLAIALALLVGLWFRRSKANVLLSNNIVKIAEAKAEQAKQVAVEAEAKALESRPKLEAARAKIIRADAKPEDTAFIPSHINIEAITTLPEARAEIGNLIELVSALDEQLTLEIQRGDAWKAAFEAEHEVSQTLKNEQSAMKKKSWRNGAKWGALGGCALTALLLIAF